MSFFFKGDALAHHDTDIGRLAKSIRKTLKESKGIELTQPEALELVCVGLGAKSLYAARSEASDPIITGMSGQQVDELRRARSVTKGAPLPADVLAHSDLPQKLFPKEKLRPQLADLCQAAYLFDKAKTLIRPGRLEFIAVVGGKGSGKSLLLSDRVYKYTGVKIDTSQNVFDRGDHVRGKRHPYQKGAILAYDRPAGIDPKKDLFLAMRGLANGSVNRLSHYEALMATHQPGIPHDDFMFPHLRNWLKEEPNVTLAVTFDDISHVEDALSQISHKANGSLSDAHWERAYVVDLKNLTLLEVLATLDGPVTTQLF